MVGASSHVMSSAYEITSCPVCGSDRERPVADADAVREEVEALWAFHTRRMAPTTDPRRLMDRVAFSQAPPIRIAQCTTCTHIFRNPRERGITGIYGGEDVEPGVLGALFDAQRATFETQAG